MAAAFRLIVCAVCAAWLLCIGGQAFAAGTVGGTSGPGTFYTNPYETTHYTSISAACNGGIGAINAAGGSLDNNGTMSSVVLNFLSGTTCAYKTTKSGNGSYFTVGTGTGTVTTCPANSTDIGGGSCSCGAGFKPGASGTSCDSACGAAGSSNGEFGDGAYSVSGNLNNLCSPAGCTVTGSVTASDANGQYTIGPFKNTGGTCTPVAGPAGPTGPTQAPGQSSCTGANMCGGLVNGTYVCAKCSSATSSSSTASSSTTTTSSSGASSTTTDQTSTSTKDNANGTSTTTTTTTHGDGSSSSTSSTCVTGTKGCTGATDDNQKDSFGGVCGGAFTCDGDAIQCAIAKEQHLRACQMFEPTTAGGDWLHGAQTLATAKVDGDVPSWSPASPGMAVTSNFQWGSTIDQSSSLAAGCPGDIFIGNSGLVLSLSSLCPYLGVLGAFIQSVTAIACAFILFKGTK